MDQAAFTKPAPTKPVIGLIIVMVVAVFIGGWLYVDSVRNELEMKIASVASESARKESSHAVTETVNPMYISTAVEAVSFEYFPLPGIHLAVAVPAGFVPDATGLDSARFVNRENTILTYGCEPAFVAMARKGEIVGEPWGIPYMETGCEAGPECENWNPPMAGRASQYRDTNEYSTAYSIVIESADRTCAIVEVPSRYNDSFDREKIFERMYSSLHYSGQLTF